MSSLDLAKHLDALDYDRLLDLVHESLFEQEAGDKLSQEYALSIGIEDYGDFDPKKDGEIEHYREFVRRKADELLQEAFHRLEGLVVEGDSIVVWREICVPEGWERHGIYERPLGQCWAIDVEHAEAHMGSFAPGLVRMVVEGRVQHEGVDWEETLRLNATDYYEVGDEFEVRLLPAAQVRIASLLVRGDRGDDLQVDCSHLKGVPFTAGVAEEGAVDPEFYDDMHHAAGRGTGFYGARGAGCVVIARSTGRMLLPLRSEWVLEPGTYGVWGGAVDPGLSPEEAARRELRQEAGIDVDVIEPLLVFAPEGSTFRYHNFLAVVDDEFDPVLNDETESVVWATLDDLPSPLHFGLEALLADPDSLARISEAARAPALAR